MNKQKPTKKLKEINLEMEFNPALMQYQPKLPLNEKKTKQETTIDWRLAILALLILFLIVISYYSLSS